MDPAVASNWAQVGASVIVAMSAVLALRTWQSEMKGKARFELAKECVLTAYRFQAHFNAVRFRAGWSSEAADRTRAANENPKATPFLDQWHAKNKRLQFVVEDLNRLKTLGWEVEMLFPKQPVVAFTEASGQLLEAWAECSASVDAYFQAKVDESEGRPLGVDLPTLKIWESHIFAQRDDSLHTQVEKARIEIASAMSKVLR